MWGQIRWSNAVTQMEKIKPVWYRGDFDKIHYIYVCVYIKSQKAACS